MRRLLIAALLIALPSACSIGPRRLQEDCTWNDRAQTNVEANVEITAIVGLLGGLAVFLPAFIAQRPDIGVPALGVMFVSVPLGWWAQGAAEEIPAPGSRLKRCRDERKNR